MNGLRLSPEESARFAPDVEFLNGYVAGARDLAETLKRRRLNEIVSARQTKPAPEPPKEDTTNGTT